MHFVTITKNNVGGVAKLIVGEEGSLMLELTLAMRMEEARAKGEFYTVEMNTLAKKWAREQAKVKHNHDPIGVYPNCPACDTMIHAGSDELREA